MVFVTCVDIVASYESRSDLQSLVHAAHTQRECDLLLQLANDCNEDAHLVLVSAARHCRNPFDLVQKPTTRMPHLR